MNSRFSDAALAYWAKVYPGNNLRIPTISTYDAALAAFDAGCAHALATVTPRTISTESELDALPVGSVVTDGDRDAWQKNRDGEWVMCGCEGAYSSRHVFSDAELTPKWAIVEPADPQPVTLLVPATAFPEPVRLTDPDDPRIRVGALVQSDSHDSIGGYSTVIYRYLLDDKPTVDGFTCGTVAYVRAQIAGGSKNYSLLTEAPDPRVELLAEALHDRGGWLGEHVGHTSSTLDDYRDAARDLLARLDSKRADV